MILLNGWDRCPCDVEPSQEGSGPERGWGATTPRAVGRMGLFKSKLPKMGRPLRPKEKGNIAGWLAYWGKGKEAVEGKRKAQGPHPTCPGVAPPHSSNTTAHAHRSAIH